jgi:hypothetical protein
MPEEEGCQKCGSEIREGEEYGTIMGEVSAPSKGLKRFPVHHHAKACRFMRDFTTQIRVMAPRATVHEVGEGKETIEVREDGRELLLKIDRSLDHPSVTATHAVEMASPILAHLRCGLDRAMLSMSREGGITIVG